MANRDVLGLAKAGKRSLSGEEARDLEKDVLATVSTEKEPMVNRLIRQNVDNIQDLVEAVNDNTKQGYGGLSADGSQILVQWLTPQHFSKASWNRDVASGTGVTFISGTMGEEEGLVIFGWANKVDEPVTDAIKIYKGTEQSTPESLAFRMTKRMTSKDPDDTFDGGSVETPIVEMSDTLVVPPETDFEIKEKKPTSGADALQPLGFYVTRAEDAWDLSDMEGAIQ